MKSPRAVARRAVYRLLADPEKGWNAVMEVEAEQYGIAPLPLQFNGQGKNVDLAHWQVDDVPVSRLTGSLRLALSAIESQDQRTNGSQARRFQNFCGLVRVVLLFLYWQSADDGDALIERAEFAADAIEGTAYTILASPSAGWPPNITFSDIATSAEEVRIAGDHYYKPITIDIVLQVDIT